MQIHEFAALMLAVMALSALASFLLAPARGRERLAWAGVGLAFPPLVLLIPLLRARVRDGG